jgi:hypothetical protein
VQFAVRKAERELTGLGARIEEARDQAAFLFGDELESAAGTEVTAKIELAVAENTIARGEIRCRYLERQIAALAEVESILTAIIRPKTQSCVDVPS